MSLAFVIESFRFHRLRSRKTVQILFLLGFFINAIALMLPVGDQDFSRLINWVMGMSARFAPEVSESVLLPDYRAESILSFGNIIYLLFSLLITVLNAGLSLIYASAMNASFDDYPLKHGVREFFSKIPKLLLFALLLIPVYILSLVFLGLPFFVIASALAFTPMFLIDRQYSLSRALDESVHATSGIKFQMVISYLFISFLMSGPRNILINWFGGSLASVALISAFFAALKALILGRLYALFYLYYSRSYPSRRIHNPYNPHDPTTFFKEVNRRGRSEEEEESDAEEDEDDDDSFFG